LFEHGVHASAWIDIDPNKIGNEVWGMSVHPPEWLEKQSPRPFVLVYVTNHGARELIADTLEGYAYRRGEDFLAVG
jgi:hypothetical protein